MADDVTLPGTGAVVATDEVSARHYQLVKPAFGADGSATLVDANNGLPTQSGWKEHTGTAAANSTDLVSFDAAGYRWVSVQITGTFSATVAFQGSNDNTNWVSVPLTVTTSSAANVSSVTTASIATGPLPARYFRVRTTAYTSGTVNATVELAAAPGALHSVAVHAGSSATISTTQGSANLPGSDATFTASAGSSAGMALVTGVLWYRLRTPFVFKSATATASGNTAVWTPASGKFIRLMRFKIDVSHDAAQSTGGVVTIELRDGTSTAVGVTQSVFVPATAATTMGAGWSSGWVDLGNGRSSSSADLVLNVNLSAALTSGTVRVIACGTEE